MDLPEAFYARMQRLLGDEYAAFLAAYSHPPISGLRVNTLKLPVESLRSLFPYPLSPLPWCPSGFILPPGIQPGKHPLHAAGLYYLQDPSAMAVAELLAPRPGERVLDLAAAPGGKTTHLAALMENRGLLVANEIHPRRAWELAENLERLGVTNAVILNETPHKLGKHFRDFFDRVLVDAPCSGEGMFRKSQVARQEWSVGLVQSCSSRQSAILREAARLTSPGGFLAYSTCTFSPEENEMVVGRFLSEHADFNLVEVRQLPGFTPGRSEWLEQEARRDFPLERTVRLWPHRGAPEGHFIAVMQRQGPARITRNEQTWRQPPAPLPASVQAAFQAFWQATLVTEPPHENLVLQGAYLYQLPEGAPDLKGLKSIRSGLWLGVMKRDRFEPSHALAMALKAEQARRLVCFTEQEALAYLHGEALPGEGEDGWVLVSLKAKGMLAPLGWGRRVQGVVKNAYPKGLRWLF